MVGRRRARDDERLLGGRVGVAHDVDVDVAARLADDAPDDRSAREALPLRATARAHDDLRRVQPSRGVEKRGADVRADDLVVRAAELLEQLSLLPQQRGRRCGEPVLGNDVDSDEIALRALGDAGSAPDEPLAVARSGQSHEDALARLPRRVDAVLLPVVGEGLVDAIGEPGKGELAKRGQVPRPEVVRERRVDPLGRVDVPAREAIAQRERGEVDDLDLVGAADGSVGNRLALLDPGDLLDDVVEGLEVLHVHRRDDADPGVEELLDVFPTLLVTRSRDVRVCELVDESDLRIAREDRVEVHLLERPVAIGDLPPRHHLEVADLLCRLLSAVRLDVPDDDVLAVVAAAAAFVQHREGLADTGGRTEVDAERPSCHCYSLTLGADRVECEVQLEHVDARLAEEAERALVGVLTDERHDLIEREAAHLGDARRLEAGVLR